MPDSPRVRVGAIVRKEGAVLLARHEKAGRSYWLPPGGGVDWGESLIEPLRREFREEARADIQAGALRFVVDTIAPDASRHIVHLMFDAHLETGEPELGDDPRVVELRYVEADELSTLDVAPPIGAELARLLDEDTGERVREGYLGARWTDFNEAN